MKNLTFDNVAWAFSVVLTWMTVVVAVTFTVTQFIAAIVRGQWFAAFLFAIGIWMAVELASTVWHEYRDERKA